MDGSLGGVKHRVTDMGLRGQTLISSGSKSRKKISSSETQLGAQRTRIRLKSAASPRSTGNNLLPMIS